MATQWLVKKLETGVTLWRLIPNDEENRLIQIDFTVEGYLEWGQESWFIEPASARASFISRRLATMKDRGFLSVTENQFEQAVARRAKQKFDPNMETDPNAGSKLLLEYLKASKDGVVRLVRNRDGEWNWCELICGEDVEINYTTPGERSIHKTMFGIQHDHGHVVSVLQNEHCCDLLAELERAGYRRATRAQLERARTQRDAGFAKQSSARKRTYSRRTV